MTILNNILYLSFADLLKHGMSENYLWKAVSKSRSKGGRSWSNIPDPTDKRAVLIEYDSIPVSTISKYKIAPKDELIKRIGAELAEQYKKAELLAKTNLKEYIKPDPEEMNELYSISKLDKGKAYEIAKACAVCRFYNNLPLRKDELKKYGFEHKADIQKALYELVKADGFKVFPENYRRFQDKFTKYKEKGIHAFITQKYGNSNTAKLKNEDQKALLRQLYARPNNFSYVKVTEDYNEAVKLINATGNNWKPLSYSTVKTFLSQPEVQKQCSAMRNGMQQWRNSYDTVIHRDRPSTPNILWVEDGTPFELYYQKETIIGSKRTVNYWCRKVVSFVIDAYNDLIIGYCIDDEENAEMKTAAWKSAVEFTGALPYEVKSDNFGKKKLGDMYQALGKHVRLSEVGNARDKVIEPMFARFTEAVLKRYSNWSGSNITARKASSHPNRELLMKIKESFPNEQEIIHQIAEAVHYWNNRPLKKLNGKSLLQQWMEADQSKNRIATKESLLEIFGLTHQWQNQLTNKGLMPTILGGTKVYQLWDHDFQDRIGDTFTIKYNPDDLSVIAATDSTGKTWFVPMENAEKMAFTDYETGDRTSLNKKLSFKKEIPQRVIDANTRDMALIESHTVLKQFFLGTGGNKHSLANAENCLKELSQPDEYDGEPVYVESEKDLDRDEYDL